MHHRVATLVLTIAATAAAAPAEAGGRERIIDLIQKNYVETYLSGGRDVLGSYRTGLGELYDPTGSHRVGSNMMSCGNVEVRDGKFQGAICTGVFRLDDGQIMWTSTVTPDDFDHKVITYAVTGGTGAYQGARGWGENRFASHPTSQRVHLVH